MDVVFGTHNVGSLPALLDRARHNTRRRSRSWSRWTSSPRPCPPGGTRVYSGWVSISVGCNNTCTFCIVPALRGKEQDRRPGDILAEVQALVADGAIEVTLLGQNVNSYGVEFGDRQAFAKLLRACGEIAGPRARPLHQPAPRRLHRRRHRGHGRDPHRDAAAAHAAAVGLGQGPAGHAAVLPASRSWASWTGSARRSPTPPSPPTSSSASPARPRRTSRRRWTWWRGAVRHGLHVPVLQAPRHPCRRHAGPAPQGRGPGALRAPDRPAGPDRRRGKRPSARPPRGGDGHGAVRPQGRGNPPAVRPVAGPAAGALLHPGRRRGAPARRPRDGDHHRGRRLPPHRRSDRRRTTACAVPGPATPGTGPRQIPAASPPRRRVRRHRRFAGHAHAAASAGASPSGSQGAGAPGPGSRRGWPPVVAVVGPTGSGKSDLAVALALELDGEVVNADAMQFYRGMDIGTAKVTAAERRGVPHHLLDILEVTEEASVSDFQQQARALDRGASPRRGKRAILVGGSGLYVRAALDVLRVPGTDPASARRLEAELDAARPGAAAGRLRSVDPVVGRPARRWPADHPGPGGHRAHRTAVRSLHAQPASTSSLPSRSGSTVDREVLRGRHRRARRTRMVDAGCSRRSGGWMPPGLRQGRTAPRALGYAAVPAGPRRRVRRRRGRGGHDRGHAAVRPPPADLVPRRPAHRLARLAGPGSGGHGRWRSRRWPVRRLPGPARYPWRMDEPSQTSTEPADPHPERPDVLQGPRNRQRLRPDRRPRAAPTSSRRSTLPPCATGTAASAATG